MTVGSGPYRHAHSGLPDEGNIEFFEGNFTEYEEYKKRTLGAEALEPKRIKYKRMIK